MNNPNNKSTFFLIDVYIPKHRINSSSFNKTISDSIDLIFCSMNGDQSQAYKIIKNDGSRIVVIFKAQTRKRIGQLNKFCQRFFDNSIDFECNSMSRDKFSAFLIESRNNKNYFVRSFNESTSSTYQGNDIKIFNDKAN